MSRRTGRLPQDFPTPEGIHKPDWGRVLVPARAQTSFDPSHTPLGDPTRWGGTSTLDVPVLGLTPVPQVLNVQCLDSYPRPWALLGTIRANLGAWPAFDPHLVLRMGVGQTSVAHDINLTQVIATMLPFYQFVADGPDQIRPFVISGGIVGNTVAASWYIAAAGAPAGTTATISMQLTPFNAGTGL